MIETAEDLTQMRVQVSMVGIQFGVAPPSIPMPYNISLVNDGWFCPKSSRQVLSSENETFTPSDVERALWSSAMETKQLASHPDANSKVKPSKSSKRKRKP